MRYLLSDWLDERSNSLRGAFGVDGPPVGRFRVVAAVRATDERPVPVPFSPESAY